MRKLFATFAIATVSLFTAPARADDATVIDYFTPENVTAAVQELGATNITTTKSDKQTVVTATIDGYLIGLGIQQCDGRPGCMGLLVAGVFTTDGKKVTAQSLVDFTTAYPPTPAIQLTSGNVAVVRAIISLGGIRNGNLKQNIALLAATLPLFAQHINGALVSTNGYAASPSRALVRSAAMSPAEFGKQMDALTSTMAASLARWPAPIRHR